MSGLRPYCCSRYWLRIHAALFQRRADKLLSGLSKLQVGTTTKAETLKLLPELHLQPSKEKFGCDGEDCYSIEVFSAFSRWVFEKISRADSHALYSTLGLWGIRYWELGIYIEFKSNTVSRVSYRLMISTPERTIPGVVIIAATSNTHFEGRVDFLDDESPNYRVESHRTWPDRNLGITFIAGAPHELVRHAFDLHFGCLWSLEGCHDIRDIAPEAVEDQKTFAHAAFERLKGPEPCPDQLLPRRVRDRDDILLLEVTRVGSLLMTLTAITITR
jgi:hypothetical protein